MRDTTADNSTNKPYEHCVVIGGGVIGLTTAHALRARQLSVTVIDAKCRGAATVAAGGILSPLIPWQQPDAVTALATRSQQMYPRLLRQWRTARCPRYLSDMDAPQRGLLFLDTAALPTARAWCKRHHRDLRELDATAMRAACPALNAERGFLLPDIHQIEPAQLVIALRHALRRDGVRFRNNQTVTDIITNDGRVTGVRLADGATIPADCVVVCAGAWTASLIPATRIRPVRGQIIELTAEPNLLPYMVLSDNRYLIPKPDGRILVGSTIEDVGFDSGTTKTAAKELLMFARRLLPCLADQQPLRHYAGLRPGASATPMIGAIDTIDSIDSGNTQGKSSNNHKRRSRGLFVNSGHFRNGITLAPAAAELITHIITGHHRQNPDTNP